MKEFLLLAAVFLASTVTTGLVRRYALRVGLIDTPNQRSSHAQPTPRGGGIAIVLAAVAALAWARFGLELPDATFAAFLLAALGIGGIGFYDDHSDLSPQLRIVVHFFLAVIAVYLLGGPPPLTVGPLTTDLGWLGGILAVVFLVWLTNLFNFMDGTDGLAASEAIFVAAAALAIGSGAIGSPLGFLQAGLAAAAAGFLAWNWPPAKIFMGDVASGFLGFALGVLALASAHAGALPIASWLILASVFVVDATITVVRRMARGDRWYAAHRSHAYQRAARTYGSHRVVLVAALLVNVLWLLPLAWLAARQPAIGWGLVLIAWGSLAVPIVRLGAGRAED